MGGACGYKEGGTVKKQMGGPLVSGPANVAPGKASKGGKVASTKLLPETMKKEVCHQVQQMIIEICC